MEKFLGNRKIVLQLDEWITTFGNGHKPAVLLWGQSGVGKTHLVELMCERHELRLFPVSCVSFESFKRSILNLRADQGIFTNGRISVQRSAILVENVDSFFMSALISKRLLKLVSRSTLPIFITNSTKLTSLYGKVDVFHMEKVPTIEIYRMLLSEPHHCSRKHVAKVAILAKGDVRFAKTMLPLGLLAIKDSDKHESPFKVVQMILSRKKKFTFQQLEHAYAEGSDVLTRNLHQKYQRHVRNDLDAIVEISDGLSASCVLAKQNQKNLGGDLAGAIVATTLWNVQIVLNSLQHRYTPTTVVMPTATSLALTKQSKMTDFFH